MTTEGLQAAATAAKTDAPGKAVAEAAAAAAHMDTTEALDDTIEDAEQEIAEIQEDPPGWSY